MKTIKRTVYDYKELSEEARKRALDKWNEDNDMSFLGSMLNDECGQMLAEKGITCTSNHPVCLYSLSHSQGDGLMFEGSFKWKGYNATIKHKGHYYHYNTGYITMTDKNGDAVTVATLARFSDIYVSICKKLEKSGYDFIEEEMSEARFIDACNENDYTFTKDGVMMNE